MSNYALWPTRDNYQRFREIMDDGDKLPVTFEEWEKLAKRQMAGAKQMGVILKAVPFDPDEFIAFCNQRKLPRGSEARGLYAITVGEAKNLI
jgi:hypothetical protein